MMADQKLSAIAASGAPTTDDLMYLVDDPGGTPVHKRVTLAQLVSLLQAELSFDFVKIGEATQTTPGPNFDIEFTLDSSIKSLMFIIEDLEIDSNDQVQMRIKQGGSYTAVTYDYTIHSFSTSGSSNADGGTGANSFKLTNDGGTWGVATNAVVQGQFYLIGDVSGSGPKTLHGQSFYRVPSGSHTAVFVGGNQEGVTTAIEGIRIMNEGGGDVDAGMIRVYGIK